MGIKLLGFMALIAAFLTGCGGSGGSSTTADPEAEATYQVTFQANWNNIDFPTNFPSNSHFSGLIGASHNSQVAFWQTGALATSGVQSVAETGSKSAFTSEINAAISNETAEYLISGDGVGNGTGSAKLLVGLNQSHSLVTLISMVAPSPDWIIGVNGLDLYDESLGDWNQQVTVDLKVYDAGTDSGATFAAANAATSPKETIQLLTSDAADTDFENGVQRASQQHIGTLTFTRQN